MGKRKLRFDQRKNYERRKYLVKSLPVSIKLSESVMVYRVSLPLHYASAYSVMDVADVLTLHTRVASHLPSNWLSSFDAEQNSLIVYRLHSQPLQEGANIYFSLTILSDFSWLLHVCGRSLSNLPAAPSTLCSVQNVVGVVGILDQCHHSCSSLRSYIYGFTRFYNSSAKLCARNCISAQCMQRGVELN